MSIWTTKDLLRVDAVIGRIAFNDWRIWARRDDETVYLQISARETCNVTGEPMHWKSRKWLLSPHMTDGEIVQTAFKAVLTALEHEAREQFTYRGTSIFDPHYDVEKLVALRQTPDALKERPAPVSLVIDNTNHAEAGPR